MRPLPRILAFSDDRVAAFEDFGIRAAAIAAVGPAVGLVARLPQGNADQLTALAARCAALVRPPEATLLVTGRVDIAMAAGAQGTILRERDLSPSDARRATTARASRATPGSSGSRTPEIDEVGEIRAAHAPRELWLLRSVHSLAEAAVAIDEEADGLIVGSIWETGSHPGRPAAGIELLREVCALGVPTWAIGGVTAERAATAQGLGAWGVAAISSLWDAPDPYQATRELLAPWLAA